MSEGVQDKLPGDEELQLLPIEPPNLDALEDEVDDGQRRPEKHHQYPTANEDHEEVTGPDGNAVVDLHGAVGEHVAQNAAAVEGRDGKQVEEAEREVDEDGQSAEQDHSLEGGVDAQVDAARESGENELVRVRRCEGDDSENEQGNQDEEQVGGGAGESGQVVVTADFFEVAGDDGSGFGPADQHAAEIVEADEGAEDYERGKDEGAEDIDVVDGVEGDAAHHAGGLVAQAGGGPGMGALVNAERKKEQDELKDGNDEGAGLQTNSPWGGKLRLAWRVVGVRTRSGSRI